MKQADFFALDALQAERAKSRNSYLEFLRVPAMSAGLYFLVVGSTDSQKPHREDELYYVVRGWARLHLGTEERTVSEGTVIFVPAAVEHRFFDIEEDLTVLVFFAPAET